MAGLIRKFMYNDANLIERYNATVFDPETGTTHFGSSYQKIGSRVILNLSIKNLGNGANAIFTLPIGFRPIQTLSFIVSDGTPIGTASVLVEKSGRVTGYTSSSGYILGYIEFFAMEE